MTEREKATHIGVYTICRNETKNVQQWIESMYCGGNGADRAYVLDTGSTDDTIEAFHAALNELDIPHDWLVLKKKEYGFFRFDVSRNDNLAMTEPDADWLDALVSVDLDEIMIPDFWPDLRDTVREHPNFERIFYLYAWNHDDSGKPKRVFWYDKVHPAKNCKWVHPVHEELVVQDENRHGEYYMNENKIYLHHLPDATKSRSSYLPLLELRAQEEPDDTNGLYYLMREYMFKDRGSLSALSIANAAYVKLSEGKQEDYYEVLPFFVLAIGDIYNEHVMNADAEHYYARAVELGRNLRQPYISYAICAAYQGKHELALRLMDEMEVQAPDPYPTWYECDYNWTWRPMQVRAVALCWAGKYMQAKEMFERAILEYITTPTAEQEARANGFFSDYEWLINYLGEEKNEQTV